MSETSSRLATPRIDLARRIVQDVVSRHAADVDRQNRFPHESVSELRSSGLLGFLGTEQADGTGNSFLEYCAIAAVLGEGCASLAFIWAQHCQQLCVLAQHGGAAFKPFVDDISSTGGLISSVTTEIGKGGDILSASAALEPVGGGFRVVRYAPVVSYGSEACYYLLTMRAHPEARPNDVRLVLVTPADGELKVVGDWKAMGMRGTRSVSMQFDVFVPEDRVFTSPYREIAMKTMIPLAHLGWASSWLGAARGAFNRFVAGERKRGGLARKLESDLYTGRLADLRMSLDLVESIVNQVATQFDSLRADGADAAAYNNPKLIIQVNNVKIAASKLCLSVADGFLPFRHLSVFLVTSSQAHSSTQEDWDILQNDETRLEQVFRDLRAAPLMFNNDRLRQSNGKLVFIEGGNSSIW